MIWYNNKNEINQTHGKETFILNQIIKVETFLKLSIAEKKKAFMSWPRVSCFISVYQYKPIINRANPVQLLEVLLKALQVQLVEDSVWFRKSEENKGTSGLYPGQRTTERWWSERKISCVLNAHAATARHTWLKPFATNTQSVHIHGSSAAGSH